MKRCYLDTSALRHLLVLHPGTRAVQTRLRDGGTTAATSEITVTELHRLGLRVPEVSTRDVDALLSNIDFVTITPEQLRRAGLLPDQPAGAQLRSLDALHLQAAIDFGATEFVTSDRRQADAAKSLRLKVKLLT